MFNFFAFVPVLVASILIPSLLAIRLSVPFSIRHLPARTQRLFQVTGRGGWNRLAASRIVYTCLAVSLIFGTCLPNFYQIVIFLVNLVEFAEEL